MKDRVLIVGAGPAGLSAAVYLTSRGIPISIFEAEKSLPKNLRASTFHPPTLDLLEPYGATASLINQGLVASKFQYRDRSEGCLAEFDFGLISDETNHPYRVQCEQFKLNMYLAKWLKNQGVDDIYFNHTVSKLKQDDQGVTVYTETLEGEKSFSGKWLIGADGANSVVRKLCSIDFEGFTWEERFLVVSTPYEYEKTINDLSFVNYFADPEQWFFLLKVPGLWRVMFPVQNNENEVSIFSKDQIQQRMQWVLATGQPFDILHTTLYKVHQRVANHYRKNRVFLVGDAAHINNPLGGMGMNGGIHDAFNLAEKLATVIHDNQSYKVLDSYEKQRRTIALDYVNKQSIKNKNNLESKTIEDQKAFRSFLKTLMQNESKAKKYLMRVSMLESIRDAENKKLTNFQNN